MTEKPVIAIDIDGTIAEITTETGYSKYNNVKPKLEVIKKVNELWFSKRFEIVLYTARGMASTNDNPQKADELYREITEKWLLENRVCYDRLEFGKKRYLWIIDDRALSPEMFLKQVIW